MDELGAEQFEALCRSHIDQGSTYLIIDFQDLLSVSSMGLRSFIAVSRSLDEKQGKMKVCRVGGLVKQVFQVTHLTKIFQLHDSVEQAAQ